MRAEPPSDPWLAVAAPAALLVGAAAVGGLLHGPEGAMAGGVLGLAAAAAVRRASGRQGERRRAALARQLPEAWRRMMEDRYEHYERLPPALRARFDDDVKIFLAEKRITGVGIELTDELRLLVAASAVTLTLGWPEADWDVLTEVLVYPQDFDRDYTFESDDLAGETHPWGTVILSAPALRESFEYPDDGYHVGLHEFAHLLDIHQTEFDGIPSGMGEAQSREWASLVEKEMERIRRGRSVLDDYGAESPVEFFAVAVEAFFEAPRAMRRRHAELYAILAGYFRQDPAAWDDVRR